MKYDVLCLPGPPSNGCGSFYVENRIGDDHHRGDRVQIRCKKCKRLREIEIRARLPGIEG